MWPSHLSPLKRGINNSFHLTPLDLVLLSPCFCVFAHHPINKRHVQYLNQMQMIIPCVFFRQARQVRTLTCKYLLEKKCICIRHVMGKWNGTTASFCQPPRGSSIVKKLTLASSISQVSYPSQSLNVNSFIVFMPFNLPCRLRLSCGIKFVSGLFSCNLIGQWDSL